MSRNLRIFFFIIIILVPIIFYKSFNRKEMSSEVILPIIQKKVKFNKPKIALIFDDLGENLKDLKSVYGLDIPVTISVIPGLKFSKNISYMASRCGFSVLVHLPLQPKNEDNFKTDKYKFIGSSLSKPELSSLLKYYLNFFRVAIGVNNHMGSAATEDPRLMRYILKAVKEKGLIFIDSRTSLNSVSGSLAKEEDIIYGENEGFLDSVDDVSIIEKKLDFLIEKAKEKEKIIIIGHPKENTFNVLKDKIPALKNEIEFITIKDYFGM